MIIVNNDDYDHHYLHDDDDDRPLSRCFSLFEPSPIYRHVSFVIAEDEQNDKKSYHENISGVEGDQS